MSRECFDRFPIKKKTGLDQEKFEYIFNGIISLPVAPRYHIEIKGRLVCLPNT